MQFLTNICINVEEGLGGSRRVQMQSYKVTVNIAIELQRITEPECCSCTNSAVGLGLQEDWTTLASTEKHERWDGSS